jgi:hypothetical protein
MEKTFVVLFTVWATCVQTSPERFAAWIIATKLLEIIYRIFSVAWTEDWKREQPPRQRYGGHRSRCTKARRR